MGVRAVFFGSSDSVFSHRHFHALQQSGCSIAAVVDVPPARRSSTNSSRPPGPTFLETAADAGIPWFEPLSPNAPDFIAEMRALKPDLFVAVGYMLLLGPELLSVPRVVAANFHASLLPAYRGKHPVFWALRGGESWCGLTVHEMSAAVDAGDVIYQVRVPVIRGDSVSALYDRIIAESVGLVSRLVEDVSQGRVPRTPQSAQGASHFGGTTEEDFRIDWEMDAQRIARWVCATPGQCFTEVNGLRLYLGDAAPRELARPSAPGTLIERGAAGCRVAAGSGSVELHTLRVDPAGERSAEAVLAELGLRPGARLGGP